MVKLAFYRAKGNLFDRLIRRWTGSPYSHVELLVLSDEEELFLLYSSSPRDGGVRVKVVHEDDFKVHNWTLIDVSDQLNHKALNLFWQDRKNAKYDWMGILLSQLFRFNQHHKKLWFCSEFCAAALGLDKPHTYSPATLYNTFEHLQDED